MDNYAEDDDGVPDPLPEPQDFHGELIRFLTESREMRNTARSSLKQGLWAGGGAIVGGAMLGPVGGMVGGIAGSIIGYARTGNYDGLVSHLAKIDSQRQRFLLAEVGNILVKAGAPGGHMETSHTFRESLMQYASSSKVRDEVWRACLNSLEEGES